jgi:hypothetical protein
MDDHLNVHSGLKDGSSQEFAGVQMQFIPVDITRQGQRARRRSRRGNGTDRRGRRLGSLWLAGFSPVAGPKSGSGTHGDHQAESGDDRT